MRAPLIREWIETAKELGINTRAERALNVCMTNWQVSAPATPATKRMQPSAGSKRHMALLPLYFYSNALADA
jgi:hypothetical protein